MYPEEAIEDRTRYGHHELCHCLFALVENERTTMLPQTVNGGWLRPLLHRTLGTLLLGCPLFIASLPCEAQNLVPNPSFEDYVTCPNSPGFNSKPLFWDRWDQSPEYFNSCAGTLGGVDTLLDVPWNGFTWQYALDGEGYVGGATYQTGDFHEQIGAQLLQPLVVGQTYYASFYTNLAMHGNYWVTKWASNNMGLLFTMDEHIWPTNTGVGPEFAIRNYAQVYSPDVITDTTGWTLVSGIFVADSAYQYVVIGNFFADSATDTVHVEDGVSLAAYYVYDLICVSATPGQCPMTTGLDERKKYRVLVYPNPASSFLNVQGAGIRSLAVRDGAGRMCLEQRGAGREFTLNLAQLEQGSFFLEVQYDDGSRTIEPFVVMR